MRRSDSIRNRLQPRPKVPNYGGPKVGNPQYNREALPELLSGSQIAYEHIAEFGGRRPRVRDIPPNVNGFWENQSFHNYADYAIGRRLSFRLRQVAGTGFSGMVRAAATPEAVRTPPYGFRVPQQNASVRQHRLGLRDRLPEHQEDQRTARE